ncbi:MAG: hypothetical protein K6F33_08640 [Bacteroidales bacterium]|nr:hypothetical protein [Bacteroidales bacterium]
MITVDPHTLSGRNRRLLYEWQQIDLTLQHRSDIVYTVAKTNAAGMPVSYLIEYRLRSICGVQNIENLGSRDVANAPVFADLFTMRIDLPADYPCADAPPSLRFATHDSQGNPIPHPWHPNIRYFGDFAGRVCINFTDTYADLAWAILRVAQYLRYERYHATSEPPYPEDMQVAAWVIRQGEPNEWIYF